MPRKKHYRRAGTAPLKKLPPSPWPPNNPPGGKLPAAAAPPNPAPPPKDTKSPADQNRSRRGCDACG